MNLHGRTGEPLEVELTAGGIAHYRNRPAATRQQDGLR
jgi:hypothetical protein